MSALVSSSETFSVKEWKMMYLCTALGCSTALYHAGLPLAARKQAHHRFINDDIRVAVACTYVSFYLL